MQSNVTRALLVILCLWLSGATLAQAPEPVPAPGVEEQQPVDDAAIEADEQAPPAPEADANQERSPHDYRPSEDISEDLSVSFPVDI